MENDNFFSNLFMTTETSEPEKSKTEEKIDKVETDPNKEKAEDEVKELSDEELIEAAKKEKQTVKTSKKEESKEVESKEEEKEETTTDFSFEPLVEDLVSSGYLSPEEIEEKGFENSPEGLKEIIKHTSDKFKELGEKEAFDKLSPTAKRLIELEKEGVDIYQLVEKEAEEVDYNSIDLDDVENQQTLYYNYLIKTGISDEKAEKLVGVAYEQGTLGEYAEISVEALSKAQEKEKEDFIKSQKAQAKAQEEKAKVEYEDFKKDVLNTSSIKGFNIDKTTASKLFDFMDKPVDKSGKTQEQLAWEDPETRKAVAYFLMNKFNFKSLEKKAETKATIKLKNKVSNTSDKGLSSKGTKVNTEEEKVPNGVVPELRFLL